MDTTNQSKRWTIFTTFIQIVIMQLTFYGSLMILAMLIFFIAKQPMEMRIALDANMLTYSTIQGKLLSLAYIINCIICAFILAKLVGRARRMLDFTVTLYILHLVISFAVYHFPMRWEWWVVQLLCMTIQTGISEYISARIEISEDPLVRLSQIKIV